MNDFENMSSSKSLFVALSAEHTRLLLVELLA